MAFISKNVGEKVCIDCKGLGEVRSQHHKSWDHCDPCQGEGWILVPRDEAEHDIDLPSILDADDEVWA